jgi:hypothetical protein
MKKKPGRRASSSVFWWVLALYSILFGARFWWFAFSRSVVLSAGKPAYLHDELIDVALNTRDPLLRERWKASPPRARVLKDGKPVTTVGGLVELPLKYEPHEGAWKGLWPCPWNAPVGDYELALLDRDDPDGRAARASFRVERRKPWPLPRGFSAVTYEYIDPLSKLTVKAPDGTRKDWRGLLDWVEYVGADALWLLAGRTPGDKPGEVWMTHNLDFMPVVARECRRRGIKLGVYAMCYLTLSKDQVGGYEYATDVDGGAPVPTRAISLREEKRRKDVVDLLKRFRDIPEVDFLGLDYIRNPLGGYELADEFFSEMSAVTPPPPEWGKLSANEKIVWFARKKIARRDKAFIDAWQWWRAHKVGSIVRRIKKDLGPEKPLWAFTLTWDKGWHHGQDPVMMNDAGIDMDALMLYEADKEQFDALVSDWRKYVNKGDVQLVVGDVIDWPLHQKDPAGPAEFYRRSKKAIDEIYGDGPASGVFIHDLDRALRGRTGPWGTKGWMDEAKRAIAYIKSLP